MEVLGAAMTSRTLKLLTIAAACVAATPAPAFAHVTLAPKAAAAGSWTTFAVKVPNESDSASTVKVALKMPAGISSASYEPVPGWTAKVIRTKLAKPIESEDGPIDEVVSEVQWRATGRGVEPGQFVPFGLTVPVPDAAGEKLAFKAVQTYSDGRVVRWIGAPDSAEPAPTVEVTKADQEGHGAAAGQSDPGSSDTLAWIAIALGVLALLVGGGALARAGREAR